MPLFSHKNRERNHEMRRVYALFELVYTFVDFAAALCFTIGSVMFFWNALETAAIWFFTIGSVLFFAKPTIRLWRELLLLRRGDYEDLAERLRN